MKEFIDTYKIPFVQTMDAKGFLPENHPLCLGMYGTAGDEAANKYFNEADLVIAMGNSFAQNATFSFKPDLFEGKQLVHINIDKAEINKVYKADVAVVSDIKLALQSIMFLIKKEIVTAISFFYFVFLISVQIKLN